jgi:glutaredoxin 2
MPQLEINGINLPVGPGIYNWEQLLRELETRHLKQNHVISSVHFDGTEILQFRDSEHLEKALHSISEVKVEAKPLQQMAEDALSEASRFSGSLQASLADIADGFRSQLIDQANSKLSEVLQGIKMYIALLEGIELSLTGQYKTGSTQVEKITEEMGPSLESLIEAQDQQDWILVADILEFELLSNLTAFERVMFEFRRKLGLVQS